jgi:hypothetical protein
LSRSICWQADRVRINVFCIFCLGLYLTSAGGVWTLHEVSKCQIPLPSVAGYHPTNRSSDAFFCGVILGSCPQALLFPHSRAPHDHCAGPHYLFGSHTCCCAGYCSAELKTWKRIKRKPKNCERAYSLSTLFFYYSAQTIKG